MRRLILFRHAEAVHSSKFRDHERPLTDAGRKDAAHAGARLAELNLPVDLVLLSDSQRTRETWDIAGTHLASQPDSRLETSLYEAQRRDLMDLARAQPDSVKCLMLVGHNPSVAEFAAHFAGSGEREALKRLAKGFPPGGIAIFEIEDAEWRKLRWGDGALTRFLT
jgi:phosphohistidine phosphatase